MHHESSPFVSMKPREADGRGRCLQTPYSRQKITMMTGAGGHRTGSREADETPDDDA
jgi:hypothetical protein